MDAAVAALIGAGIGVLVPVLDGIRRDRREDRRDQRHREQAEADRLFASRQDAVIEFVTAANAALHGPPRAPMNDYDPKYEALARAYSKVGTCVTRGTWSHARYTLQAVESFVFGAGKRGDAEDQLETFVASAQRELGFERPSSHGGAYSRRTVPKPDPRESGKGSS